jgi:hypothetical protein
LSDTFDDTLGRTKHFVIPEAQDSVSPLLQERATASIVFDLLGVLSTVHFYDQLMR